MLKLIEPTYKDKLGIGLTYPVGTQLISEILEGVPLFDLLTIHYRKHEGGWLGVYSPRLSLVKLKGNTSDLYPFTTVVEAYYSKHISDSWSIIVYRTLSKQSQQVRRFLTTIGLPLIKAWLVDERPETWYNGNRYFQVGLNKSLDQYAIRETFNDQLVNKRVSDLNMP